MRVSDYMTPAQKRFMDEASMAARVVGHPYPDAAAAEAAVELNYGRSPHVINLHNYFAQKVAHITPLIKAVESPEEYIKRVAESAEIANRVTLVWRQYVQEFDTAAGSGTSSGEGA